MTELRLVINEKDDFPQLFSWSITNYIPILVSLFCWLILTSCSSLIKVDASTGVMETQRKLAELVEMINTGQAIHQSVVNLPVNIAAEEDEDIKSVLFQVHRCSALRKLRIHLTIFCFVNKY